MDAFDERIKLLHLTDLVGTNFGTEYLCLFLHSFVRMNRPKTVVELGTGLGITAFWMALGAKSNKMGHVWTVDDFEWFDRRQTFMEEEILARLRAAEIISLDHSVAEQYYSGISQLLGLDSFLTFVKSKIILSEVRHFDDYPFVQMPIDLLFSDFHHSPMDILALLGHFLPRMAASSSIFMHSASTYWTSYLLLEQVCLLLNAGRAPKMLQEVCSADLRSFAQTHRITLVHLTERQKGKQNSVAWLKIEPVDIVPHPRSRMRGMNKEVTTPDFDEE
jgi:Methyltransferase domain